ncbi:hypothetical protein HERIO_328 [Hepatospora eriocheir]|uniref:Uncharacterized protein n=1 Tax=Hepatospora eriocheir TaxID=1081669 RepID=A0A1X0QDQ8_9MICR|nr:hypothetical protein HERIO_328 [Hepatospora eriocheir]
MYKQISEKLNIPLSSSQFIVFKYNNYNTSNRKIGTGKFSKINRSDYEIIKKIKNKKNFIS